jgi:hypothetical protein
VAVVLVVLIGILLVVRGRSGSDSPDTNVAASADQLPDPALTLTADTVVVRGNGGATVKSFSDDGTTMTLDGSADGVDKLEPGKVMLLTGVTAAKIKTVTKVGGDVQITADPAALTDVIEDGSIHWNDFAVDPDQGVVHVFTVPPGSGGGSGGDAGGGSSGGGVGGGGLGGGFGFGRPHPASPTVAGAGAGGGEQALGATGLIAGKTVSGNLGDYGFAITYEPDGRGYHLKLELTLAGDLSGKIDTDVHLKSIVHSGNAAINHHTMQNFDFNVADLGGDAVISTDLKGLQNVAKLTTPPFFKLPFSVDFPVLVAGIPFTLSFEGTIQVNLSMAIADSSLSGHAEITYDGDAGFQWKGGSLSVTGDRTQDNPNPLDSVQGAAPGPVGINFTNELPKVAFGFKFLQTGAGVYLSNGMDVSQTILPAPATCTATNVAYVLAAGADASFLGHDIDIARKAIVEKTWNYQVPNDGRCNADK